MNTLTSERPRTPEIEKLLQSNPHHLWDGSYPPGLVGEIAEWITETAFMPLPVLSTPAALATVATACGRHIIGPTGCGTALYTVLMADTGTGKDHPLKSAMRILRASDLGQHAGPAGFMSRTALVSSIIDRPNQLTSIDEMGDFIAKISSARSSHHEQGVSAFLRELFSASFDAVATPEWAGMKSKTIYAPHLSLLGATTPAQFYSALTSASIENGALNRFLVAYTPTRSEQQTGRRDPHDIPERIKSGMLEVYDAPSGQGVVPTRSLFDFDPMAAGAVKKIGWENQDAEDFYNDGYRVLAKCLAADARDAELKVRRMEIAVRIATIIAVGRFSDTVMILPH